MSVDLPTALRYYERHGCIVFWNPRDITDENLRTDTPAAEALVIHPGNIISWEVEEGQYLVKDGKVQRYQSYPRHRGIDKVFTLVHRTRWDCRAIAAISQCVRMSWEIMESGDPQSGVFAKRYIPDS